VTGGNPSNIFGTIQTNGPGGFGNANLFLMNPAGVIFGPTATLNVGGIATFTSADYLRLVDGGRFNASPTPSVSNLLTASPVAAFGFLGSNPGAITVQGSQLTATEGKGISLIGGNITIQSGTLEEGIPRPAKLVASGGQVNLVSVASTGEISAIDFMPAPGMTMGNINLLEGALLDVSAGVAGAAGTVKIRSGQLVINNSTILANTIHTDGAPVAIDIQATGDVLISADSQPAMTARSSGSGNAGEVRIVASNMKVTSSPEDFLPIIDTHTSGSGNAGSVNIALTNDLRVAGNEFVKPFFIDSGTSGSDGGQGGNITIVAKHVEIDSADINTGHFVAVNILGEEATGSGGNVTISAETVRLRNSFLATDALAEGSGGDIAISAQDLELTEFSSLSASGVEKAGALRITADHLLMDLASQLETITSTSSGGIFIAGKVLEFRNGSTVFTQSIGNGTAGDITVTATDRVSFVDNPAFNEAPDRPSGLYTNAFGITGSQGQAGSISITTGNLELSGGARFDSTTRTSGSGGAMAISADNISISGQRPFGVIEQQFGLGGLGSGIYSRSATSRFCSGTCGNAGNISISANSVSISNGGRIDSGTNSSGLGGSITITAANTVSLSGELNDGSPAGVFSRSVSTLPDAGSGGNITLNAGQSMTVSNGAAVSASSTGPGSTGNINLTAGNQLTMTNSSITTEASQSSGGLIKITTNPSGTVELSNSTISASVLDGTGGGGSVDIDPQFVILQNSQILAQAVQGPGGNINITITNGGLFLPDATSVVSASSQFGQNGAVTIQAPIAPAGGKIQPLGKAPLQVTALLSQRCAAIARGEVSSFVVAGRDTLPTEPGGWLTSPLAFGSPEAGAAMQAGVPSVESESDNPTIVSLRRLPSSSKVAQLLGDDWVTGCGS